MILMTSSTQESTRDAEELKETVEKLELEKKNDVNTRNDLQNKVCDVIKIHTRA